MAPHRDPPLTSRTPGLSCLVAVLGLLACLPPAAGRSHEAGRSGRRAEPEGTVASRRPGTSGSPAGRQAPAIYTRQQAERGRTLYEESCSTCHGRTLRGSETGPPVVGAGFLLAWEGRTVGELLDYVTTEMPPESGGGLSDADYVDITSYILRENGYPAGDRALTAGSPALEETEIRLQPSPEDASTANASRSFPDAP